MPFSVLMSLYAKEHPDYLRESLESVFSQSLPPDEVVLMEDGPVTDELQNVVNEYRSKYPTLKVILLPENGGLGKALNEGLKHCSHDLVVRMDTDDICFPDRFEKQVKFMAENPDIDISSAWLEEFEDRVDNVRSIKKVPLTHKEIADYIGSRNPLNHPAVIFRKSSVEKAGGYQHFPLFEDWYLWARMFVCGASFANIPETLLHFRTSPEMFKRRGGWKYAKDSGKFQWELHKLGLISATSALKSSILRAGVYLLPNNIRSLIYSKFLRS
ncbi:MAG: glycosyltransferase [Muribaculaceae bacterium]|nr:glycosyltransferase [Muribaculaceae bacterium]